jgi:DNA-binding response OmpR family regulator
MLSSTADRLEVGASSGETARAAIRVVVVEPSLDARLRLEALLARHDYRVSTAADAPTAFDLTARVDPDIIVLELALPGIDGVELCRRLHRVTDAYLVVVSGRRSDADKVAALSAGADDYLVKPYSADELIARLRAMTRRPRKGRSWTSPIEAGGRVTVGPITIDTGTREVSVDGEPVELTRLEFELLAALASRPRQVFTRTQLLERVWGGEDPSAGHVVDVHMSNLRRKLGGMAGAGRYVRTVRGVGFRLAGDSGQS